MNRLGIGSALFLALAASALIGASAAGAAPRTETIAPLRLVSFEARGSAGWVLDVSGNAGRAKVRAGAIGFSTHGPDNGEVDYIGVRGRVSPDYRIAARAPGLGRVAVRFDPTSETVLASEPEAGCTAHGRAAILKGVFRGPIEFHGEHGYTTVSRRSARGEVLLIPGETCRRRTPHRPPPEESLAAAGVEYLLAGGNLAGGEIEFNAFRLNRGHRAPPPSIEFTARYTRERHGILSITYIEAGDEDAADFTLAPTDGRPREATVSPPAPFSGSATFKLESPTEASWTGDLSVEIPTLGEVSLTEAGFWSGACAAHCTKTFPPGGQFGFLVYSHLP